MGIMTPVPHPAIYQVARTLMERAYDKGEFGPVERSDAWLEAKAQDLADVLEGAYIDWLIEAVKLGEKS